VNVLLILFYLLLSKFYNFLKLMKLGFLISKFAFVVFYGPFVLFDLSLEDLHLLVFKADHIFT